MSQDVYWADETYDWDPERWQQVRVIVAETSERLKLHSSWVSDTFLQRIAEEPEEVAPWQRAFLGAVVDGAWRHVTIGTGRKCGKRLLVEQVDALAQVRAIVAKHLKD